MKTSDIVQLKQDVTAAMEAAGRKEFCWFILVEKLDELGYDIVQRPVSPESVARVLAATAAIAEPVDLNAIQADGTFIGALHNGELLAGH